MLMAKRKPAKIGEILGEEFLKPLRLARATLAEAMGVPRKHVNELVTAHKLKCTADSQWLRTKKNDANQRSSINS